MGVTLYNKKSSENFSEIIERIESFESLCNELNINSLNNEVDRNKMKISLFSEVIKNSHSLRYSDWGNFLEKYIWSFFDKQEISFEEFNNDVEGSIDTKNMEILIEHLKLINVDGEINNEIKEFLLKQEQGITYS